MIIRSLEIDGFGCLLDTSYSLTPGLNILFGPNEIGKSTLQQAILALLYGFYSKSRRNKEEDALLERFRPWRGTKYGGRLEYALDAGKRYRVIRNFDGDLETHLLDALTSRDLSAEFERGKLGRLDFAEKQFGLSYEVFVNTCFVRQADLHRLDEVAQKISETVMNLADTGSRDRSVSRAQLLLENAFATHVGSERAITKPLPTAKRRLQELENELVRTIQQRKTVQDDYLALQASKGRVQGVQDELARLAFLLAREKHTALCARIETLETLTARANTLQNEIAALAFVANFSSEARDEVLRLNQMRLTQRAALAESEAGAVTARTLIETLDARIEPLRLRVCELEPARAVPYERQPQVQELERRWQNARRETANAQTRRDETLRVIETKRTLLPVAENDLGLERTGIAWLHQRRGALQTARAEQSQAEKFRDSTHEAWRAHAQTNLHIANAPALDDAPTALVILKQEQDRVNFWLARRELETLEKQVAEIRQTQARIQQLTDEINALAFVASSPIETRTRILQLEAQWRAQRDLVLRQKERAALASAELDALKMQAAPLASQVQTLSAAREVPIERADEIRALQQDYTAKSRAYDDTQSKFVALENQLATKKEIRAALAAHSRLLDAPPETLPVLRAQWNTARQRAQQMEQRAATARVEWHKLGLDTTELEQLQKRLTGVDANLLAELKVPAPMSDPPRDLRPFFIAAMVSTVLGIAGLLLLVLGISMFGGVLLIAAIVVLAFAIFLLTRRPMHVPAPTDTRITARGFANVQEMESAFATLERARPLRDQIRETERAFEQAHAELARYANQLAVFLGVDADTLTDEMLANWETRLREWRAEQRQIAALEETRLQCQREADIRKMERDVAWEKWRAALIECGFYGTDLAKETDTFLARCGERRELERCEGQLRALHVQMETKRETVNQAKRERATLASIETELAQLFASANIEEPDVERAFVEYHRRADLAVKRRELQTARETLERDASRSLQAAPLEQLTLSCDSLRADLARLASRTPSLTQSISNESPHELNDKRRQLVEARSLVEQWIAAEDTLQRSQKNFDAIYQELAARLELADSKVLTEEELEAAENQLRIWGQTRQELAALESQLEQQERAYVNTLQIQEQLENELRALISSGELDTTELERAVREFFVQCENRRELERLEAQLRALDIERQTKLEQIQNAESADRALQATENALRELLARIGIPADDLERGVAEYHYRVERAQERNALLQTLNGVEREMRAVLANDSLEQLERARDELASTLAHPHNAVWETRDASGTPAQWEQQRALLESERVKLASEIASLETRLQTALGGTRSLAEIEEEIADLRERVGVLTQHGQALELAQEFLSAAAEEHHRDFLPRLNESVSRSLKLITAGRYQTVSIDHSDFQVRLEIPERALPVTPEQLSRGAQEQIYLLLRLGLTELMSSGRERLPLILDDPLVNYDTARLHHALDFLADLAAQSQILLFTKDAEIVKWFLHKKLDAARHRLHWMNSDDAIIFRDPEISPAPEPPQQVLTESPVAITLPPALGNFQFQDEAEVSALKDAYVAPPQRGERDETRESRHREPKPELVCWKREGWWQVGVVLPDDLARNARLELYQRNVLLTPDHRSEKRWLLESLSQNVLVHWAEGQNIKQKSLALDDAKYFIFKLHGRTREQGRRVQTISTGIYLALVPETWQRDDALAGEATRNPEPCAIDCYRAHFFEFNGDDTNCVAFLDEQEKLIQEKAGAQSFFLVGHRILDGERDKGPLFGLAAPRVRLDGNLSWADIQIIEVGQEGRGEGEWRQAFAVDVTKEEQSLEPITSQGAGWYFVRFKDADNTLLESLDFRFCRGLRKIVLPESAPMPSANGHLAATIEIQHDSETFVTPTDTLTQTIKLIRTQDGTRFVIPNGSRFDTTRWHLDENTESTVEIVTRVERVWWTFADEAQEPSEWHAECMTLALQDFLAVSAKAFWLRLPTARWAKRVQIRFGNDTRLLNFRADEQVTYTPLRGFETVARDLPLGVHPFRIEIQRDEKTYEANIGELRIVARCQECGEQFAQEKETVEHVQSHLDSLLHELSYQELRERFPKLPQGIYRCPYCSFYLQVDDIRNYNSVIGEHIRRNCKDAPRTDGTARVILLPPIKDAEEIRKYVFANLPKIFKCRFCASELENPSFEQRWQHLYDRHRARLYQRV